MFILTMVIMLKWSGIAVTTVTAEYTSKQKCEDAIYLNRAKLSDGTVVLASCTAK